MENERSGPPPPRGARGAKRADRASASQLASQSQAAFDGGDFRAARVLAERAVAEADRSPSGDVRATSRRRLAMALLYDDLSAEATRVAEEAVRIARAARSFQEEALSELVLAEVRRAAGEYIAGIRHAGRARTIAARAGDELTERIVMADYALLLSRLGDHERAREAFDVLLARPLDDLPPAKAFRALYNLALVHRAAGRTTHALEALDRAEALARGANLRAVIWPLAHARAQTLIDLGAFEEASALLGSTLLPGTTPGWQRAQHMALRALVILASGGGAERGLELADEGLAMTGLLRPVRFALERARGLALLQLGRADEAERAGIALMALEANAGTRALAAEALALAARAGPPEAWLLRWLGALAIASGGAAGRVEHEACAALVHEPDPIGSLARATLPVLRSRLVERAPPAHRGAMRRLLRRVEAHLSEQRTRRAAGADTRLSEEVRLAKDQVGLAGSSPSLLRSIATIARAARSEASVVLLGETGAGKELFARLVHRLSPRAGGPFVAITCGAIPEPMLEAELFGHERGAFTGAERARRGLLVEAERGTLFLDEVGEMTQGMQVKLLRVLEDREVRAVGSDRSRRVDVRVVAATHRDLQDLVRRGVFREDLYYRLAGLSVPVPALRERMEDIPSLARALLARDPTTQAHRLDVPALAALADHPWPGNVRELSNVLRVAAALAESDVIGRPEITAAMARRTPDADGPRPLTETTLAALRARHESELRALVGRAIAAADGNKRDAARALGVSRQGLYRILGR